ncbi:undecaprenyldiphospho-muramoylpentapeptide beta-N-acetylglucosaminyltransferase [Corynebacterium epidermidicanis]|uniref:UDP-N-acetylglucosamine--N-acetylmuramyl-(pentapeptide) pyrophosphoryl-undecaprenol N-acetylglucosamine transferase n=1 Tax=Corynebacterium epidermidicanis TaxID=1050174 RepID=A0A0G3GQP4_9CORY|nr:undecaprenyldiphospho-muramoylpentapeptide beta-N-acetylglucosaminyltransferase [Corynebacterium epidermidicanis]AKK03521.1 UDP-N-acetylglucosamine-N-acetylmuramyl-(pentapeptide) pyrophosphoryl-undecaprenol N-acetylglucosamine transferase [Corynebacterium epidermidicanis]
MATPTTQLRVLVAGGGTAGHIEPALAVAEALVRDHGAEVLALGTPKGLETDLVPARGFDLKLIDPVPVPRKPSVALLKLPYRVVRAVRQTQAIIRKHNIDVVAGFGGYVSAPAYIAARLTRTPFVVHEANARAGMANKLGVRLGGVGLNAVADSGMPGQVVGVPIRASLSQQPTAADRAAACELWGLRPELPTLLVTGGSQGARSINNALAVAAPAIVAAGFQILHAYGKKNEAPDAVPGYVAVPYIERMDLALAVADLIVSRAGAMTVAEVTAAAVPALYVPLPHGNGEQALNAMPIVNAGGAQLIPDSELDGTKLAEAVIALLGDADLRQHMSRVASETGLGHAAEEVATIVAGLSRRA